MNIGPRKSEEMERTTMNNIADLYGSYVVGGHSVPMISDVSNPYFSQNREAPYTQSQAPDNGYFGQTSLDINNIAFASSSYSGNVENKEEQGLPMQAEELFHGHSRKGGQTMAAMREMVFRIAAMQPINIDPETVKPPKRRNVKISKDPQSVAARHRREKISERIRILQRLVPGGTKMDTASMLDEAIHYVKFLQNQVHTLETVQPNNSNTSGLLSSSSSPSSSSGFAYYSPANYIPNFALNDSEDARNA